MSLSDNGMTMTMPVAPTGYNNGGGFGFGDDGLALLFLFGLMGGGFGGFGGGGLLGLLALLNGGIGGWGGNGGMNGGVGSEVQRGFDHSAVVQKLDGITQGICDSTYALNNTMTNGFHGVDNAICNLGYQTQQGFNQTNIALMQGQSALAAQLANCCCETREAIQGVNYNLATQSCETRNTIQNTTRDIIDNANANSRAILDFLTQDKIATLTAENQNLKFAASQSAQNAYLTATIDASRAELIRRLGADCPQPAYVVQPPQPVTFPVNCCGQANYGNNCGY